MRRNITNSKEKRILIIFKLFKSFNSKIGQLTIIISIIFYISIFKCWRFNSPGTRVTFISSFSFRIRFRILIRFMILKRSMNIPLVYIVVRMMINFSKWSGCITIFFKKFSKCYCLRQVFISSRIIPIKSWITSSNPR